MPDLQQDPGPVPALDAAYVADAGQAVGRLLARTRTAEIAYTPGNGTLYELVLVPCEGWYSAHEWMERQTRGRSIVQDRPELAHDDEYMVIVAWLGHGAWQFDLRHIWHDSYICEKYADCTVADAAALRQLMLAVSDALGFRSLAVVR